MKSRDSNSARRGAARRKLAATIAAAQKKADAAKKAAKLAKARLKLARRKFKQVRRDAKKLRKVVKTLRAEFSSLVVKPRRRPAARKSVANVAVPAVVLPTETAPAAIPAVPPPAPVESASGNPPA